jgi:hypothetical protein
LTTTSHATRETVQLAATTAQNTSTPKFGFRNCVFHTCAAASAEATIPLTPVPAKYALVKMPRNRDRYGTRIRLPLDLLDLGFRV